MSASNVAYHMESSVFQARFYEMELMRTGQLRPFENKYIRSCTKAHLEYSAMSIDH